MSELILVQGDDGVWCEKEEPYTVIEVQTKEDYVCMQQLLAAGKRMRWRRPEDETPPEDENVLVIANGVYHNIEFHDAVLMATYYDGEGWVLEGYPELENVAISAWMPLPLLPGEVLHE